MRKILAADDDRGMRAFYEASIAEAGFELCVVDDATAAIIECLEFRPDLLILDAMMGAGGGVQVFEKIRNLLDKDIPVIFVTGMPEKVRALGSRRNVLILQKPVSSDVLVSQINRMLESGPA